MSDQVSSPGNPTPNQDPALAEALERQKAMGQSLIKIVSTRVLDPNNPDVEVVKNRHGMITQRGLDIVDEKGRLSIDMYGERPANQPVVEIETVHNRDFLTANKTLVFQDGQIHTLPGTAESLDGEVRWAPQDFNLEMRTNPDQDFYDEITELASRLIKQLTDYADEHGTSEEEA